MQKWFCYNDDNVAADVDGLACSTVAIVPSTVVFRQLYNAFV